MGHRKEALAGQVLPTSMRQLPAALKLLPLIRLEHYCVPQKQQLETER